MRDSQEHVETALAAIPAQESAIGLFVSQDGATAVVDVAGQRLDVRAATATPVLPGDAVRLERRGVALVMLGPSAARATTGKVIGAGNPAVVEFPPGSGVTASLTVNAALAVAIGDLVVLDWSSGGTVLCKVGSTNPTKPPEDTTVTVERREEKTFYAIDSGSYESPYGWRSRDVYASSSNIGAWFYGSSIMDTIPDDARIERGRAFLPIKQDRGDPPNLGTHGHAERPSGTVAVGSTIALSGRRSGDIDLPVSWIERLRSEPGGLGFNHGGYNIYRSRWDDGNSGAITVVYHVKEQRGSNGT